MWWICWLSIWKREWEWAETGVVDNVPSKQGNDCLCFNVFLGFSKATKLEF